MDSSNLLELSADPLIIHCKKELASKFDMKDLGLMHYYLGLEVCHKHGKIFLQQWKYVVKILQKFGLMDFKSMENPMLTDMRKLREFDSDPIDSSLYQQSTGSLMYLVNTRPNICFVVNTLSQFQVEPRHEHWIVAKHILRYLHGMLKYGLRYSSNNDVQLHGFTDSDWAESADDKKSTSGICFRNSAEAEYIAACDACMEAIWLCKLVYGLFD
jgi:hypothetical protein